MVDVDTVGVLEAHVGVVHRKEQVGVPHGVDGRRHRQRLTLPHRQGQGEEALVLDLHLGHDGRVKVFLQDEVVLDLRQVPGLDFAEVLLRRENKGFVHDNLHEYFLCHHGINKLLR